MRTGDERPTASSVAGAIRWAVGGSNRPTSSFVTCGSSVRVPGGMRSTATRCWHCAVPSITGPSIRCLRVINSGYGKRKNHRMLPCNTFLYRWAVPGMADLVGNENLGPGNSMLYECSIHPLQLLHLRLIFRLTSCLLFEFQLQYLSIQPFQALHIL